MLPFKTAAILLAQLTLFLITAPKQTLVYGRVSTTATTVTTADEETYADALDRLNANRMETEVGEDVGAKNFKKKVPRREQTQKDREEYQRRADRRREQRESGSSRVDVNIVNEQLKNFKEKSEEEHRDRFHQRQKEKFERLDEMHKEISDKIDAHHEGRTLMNDEELEKHHRRKEALEKKRRHLEDETSDNYVERMKRHDRKFREKLERKKARYEDILRKRGEEF
mmetsp:Transcript_288/g.652  ORF Transcript_288/g.652 Transcript_288/m.652 type:complete len:226 (-) Transcript_288:803-1480(-)